MNILQVSMQGSIGGAGRMAMGLHAAFRECGHPSMLAVGYPTTADLEHAGIYRINSTNYRNPIARSLYFVPERFHAMGIRGSRRLAKLAQIIAEPKRYLRESWGFEDYDFPATKYLLTDAPEKPEIVHCHNLHTEYFDIRVLPELSKFVPVALTLHDMWLLTGHCAHAKGCKRWQTGCGDCPDLRCYPSIKRDRTKENSEFKREIINRSALHLVTPSEWLLNLVKRLDLKLASSRVINNGVDVGIFTPKNKEEIRQVMGLPSEARVIVMVGEKVRNAKTAYRDAGTLSRALNVISHRLEGRMVFLLQVGSMRHKTTEYGNIISRNYGYLPDESQVARVYQAADILLYASKADTFPTVVLESLACGTPVVATSVGGIPEQIKHGSTGFLVPQGDYEEMANRALQVLQDDQLRGHLSETAVRDVGRRFNLHHQARRYLDFYAEILYHQPHRQPGNGG